MEKIKNKVKGFTLTEILTVIVIIGVLATLVFGGIEIATNVASDKLLEQKKQDILSAAKLYINDNPNKINLIVDEAAKYAISIDELIEYNYILSDMEYRKEEKKCECHNKKGCIKNPKDSCPIEEDVIVQASNNENGVLSYNLTGNCENKKIKINFYKNDGTNDLIDFSEEIFDYKNNISLNENTCDYTIKMPNYIIDEEYETLGFSLNREDTEAMYDLGESYTITSYDKDIKEDVVTINLYAITRKKLKATFKCSDNEILSDGCYIYNGQTTCELQTPKCSDNDFVVENGTEMYSIWSTDTGEFEKIGQGGTITLFDNYGKDDQITNATNGKFTVLKLSNIEQLKWVKKEDVDYDLSKVKAVSARVKKGKFNLRCEVSDPKQANYTYIYDEKLGTCKATYYEKTIKYYYTKNDEEGNPTIVTKHPCYVTMIAFGRKDGFMTPFEVKSHSGYRECNANEYERYGKDNGFVDGKETKYKTLSSAVKYDSCPTGWEGKSDGYCYNTKANPNNLPKGAQINVDSPVGSECVFYSTGIGADYVNKNCSKVIDGKRGVTSNNKCLYDIAKRASKDKTCTDGSTYSSTSGKCELLKIDNSKKEYKFGCKNSTDKISNGYCVRNAIFNTCEPGWEYMAVGPLTNASSSCVQKKPGSVSTYQKTCDYKGGTLTSDKKKCEKNAIEDGYKSCSAGYEVVPNDESRCRKRKEKDAEVIYGSCKSGYKDYNTTKCISETGTNPTKCESGYVRETATSKYCYKYEYKNALRTQINRNDGCISGYTKSGSWCWKCPSGYSGLKVTNGNSSSATGKCKKAVDYYNMNTNPKRAFCESGVKLEDGKCHNTYTKSSSYKCDNNYTLSGTKCISKTEYVYETRQKKYKCDSSKWTLSGTKCTIASDTSNIPETCKNGSTLLDNKCVKLTYDKTKLKGGCPAGYDMLGTDKCQKKIETIWSCSGGYKYNEQTKNCQVILTRNPDPTYTCNYGSLVYSNGWPMCQLPQSDVSCKQYLGTTGTFKKVTENHGADLGKCTYKITNPDNAKKALKDYPGTCDEITLN